MAIVYTRATSAGSISLIQENESRHFVVSDELKKSYQKISEVVSDAIFLQIPLSRLKSYLDNTWFRIVRLSTGENKLYLSYRLQGGMEDEKEIEPIDPFTKNLCVRLGINNLQIPDATISETVRADS